MSQPVEPSKKQANKPIWITVLIAGVVMIILAFTMLITNMNKTTGGNAADFQHKEFSKVLDASIEKVKAEGISETITEQYKNNKGDTGTITSYKYYNAETKEGASCLNDCKNPKAENIDAEMAWLKLITLQKTHTQYYITQIDSNTYKIQYASNSSTPETWVMKDGLFTEASGNIQTDNSSTEWVSVFDYKLNEKGIEAIANSKN